MKHPLNDQVFDSVSIKCHAEKKQTHTLSFCPSSAGAGFHKSIDFSQAKMFRNMFGFDNAFNISFLNYPCPLDLAPLTPFHMRTDHISLALANGTV
jgi:hypothetical protein